MGSGRGNRWIASESGAVREGLVVCAVKHNGSNENEMGGGPAEVATPETNAYETTARSEGRATSNGGSVPRCELERAVERPASCES